MKLIKGDILTLYMSGHLYYLRVTTVESCSQGPKYALTIYNSEKMKRTVTITYYTQPDIDYSMEKESMKFVRHEMPSWKKRLGGN